MHEERRQRANSWTDDADQVERRTNEEKRGRNQRDRLTDGA